MKIALIAPLEESIPPQFYGGIEWIVYYLAHLLGVKGHEVDLYATGDSNKEKNYTLIPIVPQGLRTQAPYSHNAHLRESAKWLGITHIIEQINTKKYDIVHNHASWRMLNFANLITPPMITTHHGPLSQEYQQYTFMNYRAYPHVSISLNQRNDLPDLNYVKNIYNGTDVVEYPYLTDESKLDAHMAFLARMSPEKGGIEAAIAAKKTGHVLRVAAKVDEIDKPYFEQFKPYIDNQAIFFVEEVSKITKLNHIQTARCLLAPIQWEEPFGLMFTEAMACGTPVIAYSRGSAPEIIQDGITGYLVNQSPEFIRGDFIVKKTGVEGLCEAIERIYALPQAEYTQMRKNSRARVEQQFTVEKMVNEYEALYKSILNSNNIK